MTLPLETSVLTAAGQVILTTRESPEKWSQSVSESIALGVLRALPSSSTESILITASLSAQRCQPCPHRSMLPCSNHFFLDAFLSLPFTAVRVQVRLARLLFQQWATLCPSPF